MRYLALSSTQICFKYEERKKKGERCENNEYRESALREIFRILLKTDEGTILIPYKRRVNKFKNITKKL